MRSANVLPTLIDLDAIGIGMGNPLQWRPASVLNIPDPASCTDFDAYGKLRVVVTDKNGVSGQTLLVLRMTRVC